MILTNYEKRLLLKKLKTLVSQRQMQISCTVVFYLCAMKQKTHTAMKKNQCTTATTSNEPKDFYEEYLEKIQLLTPEEEQALGQRIRQGDIKARDELVEANLRFVYKCAQNFSTYNVPQEELISAGNAALTASAARFDPVHGTRFISYAVHNIKQSMFDTVNEYAQMVHIPSDRLKEVKFRYESLEVFDSPYDDDDNDYLAPQNRLQAEPTTSQTEQLYDEECEDLRHFLSQHLCASEVNFLMDYAQMNASGLKPKELAEKLAEKHRLPTRLVKSRIKSLRKKVNDHHLYAAYFDQAA